MLLFDELNISILEKHDGGLLEMLQVVIIKEFYFQETVKKQNKNIIFKNSVCIYLVL